MTWATPVRFGWTRQTNFQLPGGGEVTLKVCALGRGGVLTQVEPSNEATPKENPGHPTLNGKRTCPDLRRVMVWISSALTVQVMVSPVWIQTSLGRKARAWRALSGLWAPTARVQVSAWAETGTISAINSNHKMDRNCIGVNFFIMPPQNDL